MWDVMPVPPCGHRHASHTTRRARAAEPGPCDPHTCDHSQHSDPEKHRMDPCESRRRGVTSVVQQGGEWWCKPLTVGRGSQSEC